MKFPTGFIASAFMAFKLMPSVTAVLLAAQQLDFNRRFEDDTTSARSMCQASILCKGTSPIICSIEALLSGGETRLTSGFEHGLSDLCAAARIHLLHGRNASSVFF